MAKIRDWPGPHCVDALARRRDLCGDLVRPSPGLFVAAFRAAAERLGRGCKDVVFPEGCFPPPLPFCRSG